MMAEGSVMESEGGTGWVPLAGGVDEGNDSLSA